MKYMGLKAFLEPLIDKSKLNYGKRNEEPTMQSRDLGDCSKIKEFERLS